MLVHVSTHRYPLSILNNLEVAYVRTSIVVGEMSRV